jgi:hypothetical protein
MSRQVFSPEELRAVSVAAVCRYFERAGWHRRDLDGGGLAFESPPAIRTASGKPLGLSFPESEDYADYPLRAEDLISSLSSIEDRSMVSIWKDLTTTPAKNGRTRTGSGT